MLSEAWKRRGEARGGILTWIQRWSLEKSRFGRGGGPAEAIDFQTNNTLDMALILPELHLLACLRQIFGDNQLVMDTLPREIINEIIIPASPSLLSS